jgi:hypothetical protein
MLLSTAQVGSTAGAAPPPADAGTPPLNSRLNCATGLNSGSFWALVPRLDTAWYAFWPTPGVAFETPTSSDLKGTPCPSGLFTAIT